MEATVEESGSHFGRRDVITADTETHFSLTEFCDSDWFDLRCCMYSKNGLKATETGLDLKNEEIFTGP